MGHKVAKTTHEINNTFGPGTASEHIVQWWSGQVSRGSAGEDQADERAVVARLSWRVSGR